MVTVVDNELRETQTSTDALRAFVLTATTDEVVDRIARTEERLGELDERLRQMKQVIDDAQL